MLVIDNERIEISGLKRQQFLLRIPAFAEQPLQYGFYFAGWHADGGLNGIHTVEKLNYVLVGIHTPPGGVVSRAFHDHISTCKLAV